MGDRCNMTIFVAEKDYERAREVLKAGECDLFTAWNWDAKAGQVGVKLPEGVPMEPNDTERGILEFYFEEVNYGAEDDRIILAAGGIVFTGWHGEGGGYPGNEFCSTGSGELFYIQTAYDMGAVVSIDEDGNPKPEAVAAAKQYRAAEKQAEAYFDTIRAEYDAQQAAQNSLTEA